MADTPDGIYRGALDGLGVAYAPVWLFEKAVLDGRLQLLLLEHLGSPAPIHIVYSAKRLVPRRTSAFMNFVAEEVSRLPSLNEGAVARLVARIEGIGQLANKVERRKMEK
jgi:DNA-binding transcriptional LysR family regulator